MNDKVYIAMRIILILWFCYGKAKKADRNGYTKDNNSDAEASAIY
ncbi:MAG TPA: hypothetical protein VNZ45_01770 [Bacteroidia bacterium]|nr:hypothetical protein [Bacteroidia bacterium]